MWNISSDHDYVTIPQDQLMLKFRPTKIVPHISVQPELIS
jgi:hypothetical protein